ncbi:MAG TPA: AAA family ATPase [Candidatus Nanoarchaeia archaeon]|nr:AAA family ATPase [Candidatus Nanoarchaeia archaeon]
MALFKDILASNETLFKNDIALEFDYQPKITPYREREQRIVAECIKPLFNEKSGKNVFIYGQPGVGKTVSCKHITVELEDQTDDIIPIYVNCWQRNTTFKILYHICEKLDFKFIQNKKTEELFNIVKQSLNKKSVVFILDEVDKLEELDFIYMILEDIYRKTIVLITNYKEWIINLDERIKSRLMPEVIEFKPYNQEETKGILKQRIQYAFHPGVWDDDAFELVAKKTFEMQDLRTGLHLMKEAAHIAESKSSRKIILEHAQQSLNKIEEFTVKNPGDLASDEQLILETIKKNSGKRIGDLFKLYQENNGKLVYKSFQRKIEKLEKSKFITVEKTEGGVDGNTTIVKYKTEKKLTDF